MIFRRITFGSFWLVGSVDLENAWNKSDGQGEVESSMVFTTCYTSLRSVSLCFT